MNGTHGKQETGDGVLETLSCLVFVLDSRCEWLWLGGGIFARVI